MSLIKKIFNRIIPDEIFLKYKYKKYFGKKIDLKNPKTFNEKLQWLKLYDRKDAYTKMVDKYEVKNYVSGIIGEEYIIPTLGVYNNWNDIDFKQMPKQFVLKCTHDSGSSIVCTDKLNFDYEECKKKINKALKNNFFYEFREWPYKNVKPRILIEKYMEDNDSSEMLSDYKLFCFNGIVKTILVCSNRKGEFKNTDFYDSDWNLMPFTRERHENNPKGIKKPEKLEEMIQIAEKLSKDIPFVRVDLYEINGKVYFGELTFFPSSGFEGFKPEEYDTILGNWLDIGDKNE